MEWFLCEGCGEPLTDDMLVDGNDADELEPEELLQAENSDPGSCPHCGVSQWEHGGY